MAGKFIARMTAAERASVEVLVNKGKSAAATLTHAPAMTRCSGR